MSVPLVHCVSVVKLFGSIVLIPILSGFKSLGILTKILQFHLRKTSVGKFFTLPVVFDNIGFIMIKRESYLLTMYVYIFKSKSKQ